MRRNVIVVTSDMLHRQQLTEDVRWSQPGFQMVSMTFA